MEDSLTNLSWSQTGVTRITPSFFFLTRTAYANLGKGIQWTLKKKLEDLKFTGDLSPFSNRLQDMQNKLTSLADITKKLGFKISKEKQNCCGQIESKMNQSIKRVDESIHKEGSEIKDIDEF